MSSIAFEVNESVANAGSKCRDAWAALGVLFVATFPLVGNALVYPYFFSARRLTQAALLVTGILLIYSNTRLKSRNKLDIVNDSTVRWVAALSAAILILFSVINIVTLRAYPTTYEWINLLMILGWLVFCGLFLKSFKQIIRSVLMTPGVTTLDTKPLTIMVAITGLVLAAMGWWLGPTERNNAHLSFGGSTISLGLCATIGYFISLFCIRFPINFIVGIPWAYLFIFSTARTPLLISASFYAILFLNRTFKYSGTASIKILKALGEVLVHVSTIIVLILPIAFRTKWYPYCSIYDTDVMIQYREEELVKRASRFYRLLPIIKGLKFPVLSSDTIFCSNFTSTAEEVTAVLNFEMPSLIEKVVVARSPTYPELFPEKILLDASIDGKNWKELDVLKMEADTQGKIIYYCRPSLSVFLRLRGDTVRFSDGRYYLTLGEFKAYGPSPLRIPAASTASSVVNDNYRAFNVADRSAETFWHSNARESQEEWIALDFSRTQKLRAIRLLPSPAYPELFFKHFKIESSLNGNDWQTIISINDYKAKTGKWHETSFNPTEARYVRVRGQGRDIALPVVISEIEALGDIIPEFSKDLDSSIDARSGVIELDLGHEIGFNEICLTNRVEEKNGNFDVQIQVSLDGANWTPVVSEISSSFKELQTFRRMHLGQRARFIKFSIKSAQDIWPVSKIELFYHEQPMIALQSSLGKTNEKNEIKSILPREYPKEYPAITADGNIRMLSEFNITNSASASSSTWNSRDTRRYLELVESLQNQPDDRMKIFAYSSEIISKRITGYWPASFQETSKLGYKYPHNVLLEISFYYGWIVGVFVVLGMSCFVFTLIVRLVRTGSLTEMAIAVAVAANFARMQISSNLFDHLNILLLALMWVFIVSENKTPIVVGRPSND